MDARIVAEAAEISLSAPSQVIVTTVIDVEDFVLALESLFDAAAVLAPLRNMGNSVTAVAPDFTNSKEVSVQAVWA